MEKIIEPIRKEKLIAELKSCKLIKKTKRRENEIFSFFYRDAPSIMYEVGRLRETALRLIGCGSGNVIDLDNFDMEPSAYRQLIVWNPRDREIIGGYRYAVGKDYLIRTDLLSLSHFFRFSKKFVLEYLPYSIELGRAWVNPLYQPSATDSRSIFALDNLWEGLGAVVAENEEVRFLIGKVTIPGTYNPTARTLISWFMSHYYGDQKNLLVAYKPIISPRVLSVGGQKISGSDPENDYKIIANFIKNLGVFISPLISAYLRLANDMVSFGSTLNPELENSYETGIMIDVNDIYPEKYTRYIQVSGQNEPVCI